jgi:formylmethanofuran dehydrogenase subunit E
MSPEQKYEWSEHLLCARCGVVLGEDYHENPLGVRFCTECFHDAVVKKEQERSAEMYLKGRCSNCGGSLINGYRLSRLGVVYCIACFDNLQE